MRLWGWLWSRPRTAEISFTCESGSWVLEVKGEGSTYTYVWPEGHVPTTMEYLSAVEAGRRVTEK